MEYVYNYLIYSEIKNNNNRLKKKYFINIIIKMTDFNIAVYKNINK